MFRRLNGLLRYNDDMHNRRNFTDRHSPTGPVLPPEGPTSTSAENKVYPLNEGLEKFSMRFFKLFKEDMCRTSV